MNPARPTTSEQRKALKIAAQIVVNLLGGGKQAARLTVVDPATLSLYGAPHEDARHMRIDVALDLDLAAGEPVIAMALAAAQGYSLVRLDAGAGCGPLTISDFARLQREAFEAKAAVLESIADPDITPAEKRRMRKELADLRLAVALIESKLDGE